MSARLTTEEATQDQAISNRRLTGSITRSLILTIILITSTGPLIRHLFAITLKDLAVFIVGLLWILGDLIPTTAILFTIYDILIVPKRDESHLFTINGKRYSISQTILTLFAILYLIDFILFVSLHTWASNSNYISLTFTLRDRYRHAFFHLQVFICIIYMTKPWKWAQIDLRDIMLHVERSNLILYKIAHAISQRLNSAYPLNEVVDPLVPSGSTLSDRNSAVSAAVKKTVKVALANMPPAAKQVPRRPGKVVTTRRATRRVATRSVKTTRLKRISANNRRVTAVIRRQGSSTRARVVRRSQITRGGSSSSRGSAQQTVLMRVGRSCGTAKSLTRRQIRRTNKMPDTAARTVNLNLNMN